MYLCDKYYLYEFFYASVAFEGVHKYKHLYIQDFFIILQVQFINL